MMHRTRHRAGGWSLVELAVVIATIAVLGSVLWRILPLTPKLAEEDLARRDLAQAQQALIGYALAHNTLPTPLIDHGLGMLPGELLGLPSRIRLRYDVQAALTASPGDSFKPLLPTPLPASGGSPAPSNQINGLDLCMSLKLVANDSLTGMQGIPTAFALMATGPTGQRQTAGQPFALPGSADIGDRKVLAIGPGELASRLSCPDRVARVHGAGRAAYAAHDLARIADRYNEFREYAVRVAEMNLKNAEVGEIFAGFDIAWGVVVEAIAILQEAAGWPPEGLSIATGIAAHATATAQLVVAIVNMKNAVDGKKEAQTAKATADQQYSKSQINLTRMQNLAYNTRERAIALDAKGLQP